MTLLQCCASSAEKHAEKLYDHFPGPHDEFAAAACGFDNILHLHQATAIILLDYATTSLMLRTRSIKARKSLGDQIVVCLAKKTELRRRRQQPYSCESKASLSPVSSTTNCI